MLLLRVHSLLLLGLRLVVVEHLVLLLLLALQPPLAHRLVLRTLGVHLILDLALAGLLCLRTVDLFEHISWNVVVRSHDVMVRRTCSTRARLCLNVLPLLRW